MTRTFTIFVIFVIIGLRMTNHCLSLLIERSPLTLRNYLFEVYLKVYQSISIVIRILAFVQVTSCGMLMWMGFIVGVSSNVVTLKMYYVIPFPIYTFFPTVAVSIVTLALNSLPPAVITHSLSSKLLQKWFFRIRGLFHHGFLLNTLQIFW